MRVLLAAAMLLGFYATTAAHAEWEILDTGTPLSAATPAPDAAAAPAAATTAPSSGSAASK